jgi:hypothetical protein
VTHASRTNSRFARIAAASLLAATVFVSGGCFVANLAGAIGGEIERNKKIEVLAEYEGLENKSVAVIVHADAATLYEFPSVAQTVSGNVAFRIQQNVRGVSILPPAAVAQWQYQTPAWSTLPYGQIADELNVDRVVLIDMYEYRLNPPGNMYLWEGVAAANVGVIERNGLDPDSFAATFDIRVRFPNQEGIGRESASSADIQTGVLTKFVQKCAWLFYTHIEDKYPDARK